MSTTKSRDGVGSGASRLATGQAAGQATQTKRSKKKKVTAQALLLDMLEQLSDDKISKQEIYTKLIEEAKAGDKDARDWLGKYLLGNGKISSEDLHRQPIIRPSRR